MRKTSSKIISFSKPGGCPENGEYYTIAGLSSAMISDSSPTLDLIQRAAACFNVSVIDLIGDSHHNSPHSPGPPSPFLARFDKIRSLSRKDQLFLLRFIDTFIFLQKNS
jgi:hypothetical protein